MNVNGYHRAVEMSHIKQLMSYTQEQFEEDWQVCLALAVMMAEQGRKDHLEKLLDHYMKRVTVWASLFPECALSNVRSPFEISG
jgi:hypothetical protein